MDNNWTKWIEFKQKLQEANIVSGWNQNSTGYWYCTDVTNKYYYKDEWQYIDSKWYSFDSDGYARHDCWIQDGGKYYYLTSDCSMAIGWLQWNGNYYYLNKDGSMANGWIKDNGKDYLLYSDGSMVHDCDLYGYRFSDDGSASKL